MVFVDYGVVQRSVSPLISLVDISSSQHKHLNQRIMIVDRCNLKTVVAVLFIDTLIDWKPLLK